MKKAAVLFISLFILSSCQKDNNDSSESSDQASFRIIRRLSYLQSGSKSQTFYYYDNEKLIEKSTYNYSQNGDSTEVSRTEIVYNGNRVSVKDYSRNAYGDWFVYMAKELVFEGDLLKEKEYFDYFGNYRRWYIYEGNKIVSDSTVFLDYPTTLNRVYTYNNNGKISEIKIYNTGKGKKTTYSVVAFVYTGEDILIG